MFVVDRKQEKKLLRGFIKPESPKGGGKTKRMELRVLDVGALETNCIVMVEPESKSCLIVDPGAEAERILAMVRSQFGSGLEGLDTTIALTHCHFDHAAALQEIREATNARVLAHQADMPLYQTLALQPAVFGLGPMEKPPVGPPSGFLDESTELRVGSLSARILHTPGHTPGSCCLYFAAQNLLLSGDTLFRGSVGRTDFPGGDSEALVSSIRKKLYSLPEATRVIPGHGPETSIRIEMKTNAVVRAAAL